MKRTRSAWLGLLAVVAGVATLGLAYRFALRYRERVGLPARWPVEGSPADFGLSFQNVEIPSGDLRLAGWWVPASARSRPRPAIAVVHGWESNRARTFAHVRYLHAAGFHCLVFDVRGHGDNPPETLPISVPEFAADALAAAHWLLARPDVSAVGLLGHSMGAAGVIVAAAAEPRIGAVVSLSAPADPIRMTAKTFEMGGMRVPRPIAQPLAWLTARVLLAPRHHTLAESGATAAAARYRGPLLLLHGAQDHGVPVEHLQIIARAALAARTRPGGSGTAVEWLVLPDFGHRWLYEAPEARRKVASFLATSLGGPAAPEQAGDRAVACAVERPANPVYGFGPSAGQTPTDRPFGDTFI